MTIQFSKEVSFTLVIKTEFTQFIQDFTEYLKWHYNLEQLLLQPTKESFTAQKMLTNNS